jgi:hypothetical protein
MIWFDLDKTLWNSYNFNGDEFFAKNVRNPKYVDHLRTTVYGELGIIKLQVGVHSIIEALSQDYSIGIISLGGLQGVSLELQPSYKALELFGLLKYISKIVLTYKDGNKGELLNGEKVSLVIDDDPTQLVSMSSKGFNVLDRAELKDWPSSREIILGKINNETF